MSYIHALGLSVRLGLNYVGRWGTQFRSGPYDTEPTTKHKRGFLRSIATGVQQRHGRRRPGGGREEGGSIGLYAALPTQLQAFQGHASTARQAQGDDPLLLLFLVLESPQISWALRENRSRSHGWCLSLLVGLEIAVAFSCSLDSD